MTKNVRNTGSFIDGSKRKGTNIAISAEIRAKQDEMIEARGVRSRSSLVADMTNLSYKLWTEAGKPKK